MHLRPTALAVLAAVLLPCGTSADEPEPAVPPAPPPVSPASATPAAGVPADSLQLLVVVSRGWQAGAATLLRFERATPGTAWTPVGSAISGVVGRNGMAWGRGLHPEALDGPEKNEGDRATPAGVFRLSHAFASAAKKIDLGFTLARPGLVCVTDRKSPYYNRVVDLAKMPMSWDTDEALLGVDDSYELAVVLDQNLAPIVPGRGACIFIHVWKGPGQQTNGGVGTTRDAVETLLGWLRIQSKPMAVILPWEEYRTYQQAWSLPALQPK